MYFTKYRHDEYLSAEHELLVDWPNYVMLHGVYSSLFYGRIRRTTYVPV